ncbi:hypothetical protein GCM10025331_02650 [Actinoplanes utahensis]|uniref:Uncharacterized protein n=1 Tax=Actinoplanes utahensis TaxID=1869 RepID=A0A0A6UUB5_ACTUT|nr:hypothetical protein MB27_02700 [Actinoplanes utahensis]GIF28008.1 hypothetical protein Aut01nite_09940 [Actinoplanes utahensis]
MGGLSACRSEPTVAAYLGDSETVSEREVQEIWDDAHDILTTQARDQAAAAEKAQRAEEEKRTGSGEKVRPAPTITAKPVQMPFSRADIVHALVARDLYDRVAAERQVRLPDTVPYDAVAADRKLPAGTDYVRVLTEGLLLRELLVESYMTSATTPEEGDMREVFDAFVSVGGVQPGQDFSAWKAEQSEQNLKVVAAVGQVRDRIQAAATDLGVKVNPRYHPFEVSVLWLQDETTKLDLIKTSLGDDQSVPVADVS